MVDVGVEDSVWMERMVEVGEGGMVDDGFWKAREEPGSVGSSYSPFLGQI